MSQTISAPNFGQLNIKEKSKLDADAAVAATNLTVQYNDNIAADDILFIGRIGSESGEAKEIASTSNATAIVLAAGLSKPHTRFEDIITLFGDKIRIYYAANVDGTEPSDDDATLLQTVSIDYDQMETSYTDDDGGSDRWYKYTYYNSGSGSETPLSESRWRRGGNVGNYASIESIRRKAGITNNRYITDAYVEEKRQFAQALINSTLVGIYTLPVSEPIPELLAEITRLLAAGSLLLSDYGPLNSLDTKEGQAMIDQVMNKDKTGYLDRLDSKQLVLIGQDGVSLAIEGSGDSFKMYPDENTATDDVENGGGPRMFRTGSWQNGNRAY